MFETGSKFERKEKLSARASGDSGSGFFSGRINYDSEIQNIISIYIRSYILINILCYTCWYHIRISDIIKFAFRNLDEY